MAATDLKSCAILATCCPAASRLLTSSGDISRFWSNKTPDISLRVFLYSSCTGLIAPAMARIRPSFNWSCKPAKVLGVSLAALSKPFRRSIKKPYKPSELVFAALISASVSPNAVANVELAGLMPPCTKSRSSWISCGPFKPKDLTALTPTVVSFWICSIFMPEPRPGPKRARNVSTNSSDVAAVLRASLLSDLIMPWEIDMA